jgi:putative hemolysin
MSLAAMYTETQLTLERFPYLYRLRNLSDRLVTPAIKMNFSNQFYQVKTVDTAREFHQVLRLRYEVFFQEFSTFKSRWNLFPYDVDLHDFSCDHLIVKDLKTQKVVACYRLLSSQNQHKVDHYYSENEFEIQSFLELPGNKLELGRACVDKNFRKGTVIALLWKGLCEYARLSDSKYLFGCSSIVRKDFDKVPALLSFLKQNGSLPENFEALPTKKYRPERHGLTFPEATTEGELKGLSPLLMMYLKFGAKMSGALAYDAQMDCLDLFTVIDSQYIQKFA